MVYSFCALWLSLCYKLYLFINFSKIKCTIHLFLELQMATVKMCVNIVNKQPDVFPVLITDQDTEYCIYSIVIFLCLKVDYQLKQKFKNNLQTRKVDVNTCISIPTLQFSVIVLNSYLGHVDESQGQSLVAQDGAVLVSLPSLQHDLKFVGISF